MPTTRRCSDPACGLTGLEQDIKNFYKGQTRCIPCYKRSYVKTRRQPGIEKAKGLPPGYSLLPLNHPALKGFDFTDNGQGGVRLAQAPTGYVVVKIIGGQVSLPLE